MAILQEEIAAHGPVTYARFMELALYHPVWGYYTRPVDQDERPRIGPSGDFYTSADVHPGLGWALAAQIEQVDRLLESPSTLTVVEIGAGKGLLARDILRACASRFPALFSRLTYVLIDRSPAHRAAQRTNLAPWLAIPNRVQWLDSLDAAPPNSITGVVLSNELVDAFPVHRVQMTGGTLVEHRVSVRDGRLVMATGPVSTPDLPAYFERLGLSLPDGAIADVNLHAIEWIAAVAARLARGLVITIDYGHTAQDLFGPERPHGTLRSYARHRVSDRILDAVGQQDLTSHVDFTSLAQAGRRAGLALAGFTNQMCVLVSLDIESYCATLPEESPELVAIAHLMRPHGMGTTFKVLFQHKGLPPGVLDGLRHTPFFESSLDAPAAERS